MSSPRPEFFEPPLRLVRPRAAQVTPAPPLRIRAPAVRTWRCECGEELPEEAECDCCQSYTPEESPNPWYCRRCDDFCSGGDGLCARCWRLGY